MAGVSIKVYYVVERFMISNFLGCDECFELPRLHDLRTRLVSMINEYENFRSTFEMYYIRDFELGVTYMTLLSWLPFCHQQGIYLYCTSNKRHQIEALREEERNLANNLDKALDQFR